ncbi:unnamed protein product [Ambrosiozyma monospora]|uniref:Unnamed protein product n=1 Tax=Ambrosiozyma monospora TaxID=43982 RepID=A0ACB5TTI9_AMBMO|nr:unnamed protein product [Ambrosiozyma monospora]
MKTPDKYDQSKRDFVFNELPSSLVYFQIDCTENQKVRNANVIDNTKFSGKSLDKVKSLFVLKPSHLFNWKEAEVDDGEEPRHRRIKLK